MAKGIDVRKLAAWRERLEQQRASGLTVADFCRQYRIRPTQFYYWARRVRQAEAIDSDAPAKPVMSATASLTATEVSIGDQIRVSLPAEQPELVVSLLRSLMTSPSCKDAFQWIDVRDAVLPRP